MNTLPILVIHNPSRVDRREILFKELESQKEIGDFTLMPAINTERRPCSNISKAHKNCVRLAIEKDWPEVIIMEDDVKFLHKDAFRFFLEGIRWVRGWNPSYPLITGGHYDGEIKVIGNGMAEVKEFSGLHCYCLNSSFYQTFLEADEKINIDKWISGDAFKKTTCYCLYPFQIMQHDTYSDNVKRITNYNENIKGRFEIWKTEP